MSGSKADSGMVSKTVEREVDGWSGGWGGSEADILDTREEGGLALALRVLGLAGEGRIGEEDSAPDWKMLLSSQPLSSAHCETRLVLASD
jgi:hypothetical protein